MDSVTCPTCSNQYNIENYMEHLPSCYRKKCKEMKITPVCTCNNDEAHLIPIKSAPTKRQAIESSLSDSPFDQVSKDLLCLILQFFDKSWESLFVSLVCKKWQSIVQRRTKYPLYKLVYHYSKLGRLPSLQLLDNLTVQKKQIRTLFYYDINKTMLFSGAAQSGNIELMNWALDNGEITEDNANDICYKITSCQNYDLLKWMLQKKGFRWYPGASKPIIHHGDFKMLKWLWENKYELDKAICKIAAKLGHSEIMFWAIEKGFPLDDSVLAYAVNREDTKLIQWMLDNGCTWSKAESLIIKSGSRELKSWLIQKLGE